MAWGEGTRGWGGGSSPPTQRRIAEHLLVMLDQSRKLFDFPGMHVCVLMTSERRKERSHCPTPPCYRVMKWDIGISRADNRGAKFKCGDCREITEHRPLLSWPVTDLCVPRDQLCLLIASRRLTCNWNFPCTVSLFRLCA